MTRRQSNFVIGAIITLAVVLFVFASCIKVSGATAPRPNVSRIKRIMRRVHYGRMATNTTTHGAILLTRRAPRAPLTGLTAVQPLVGETLIQNAPTGPVILRVSNEPNLTNALQLYWGWGDRAYGGGWASNLCPNLTTITWLCPTQNVAVIDYCRDPFHDPPTPLFVSETNHTQNGWMMHGDPWVQISPAMQGTGQPQTWKSATDHYATGRSFFRLRIQ